MRISLCVLLMCCLPTFGWAEDHDAHQHGSQIFHKFVLETELGTGREGTITAWDFDGWVGGDTNKLHLKSEGEQVEGDTESAEFWAMYSRNISEFWDAQVGVRYDSEPESTAYFAAGFEGMAPYFLETEAHVFVSEQGDVSARVREEIDFLLLQELTLQPYVEANFYAQDVADLEVGQGLSDGEIGFQLRYAITRKFVPYVDVRYERLFGETSAIAGKNGEPNDDAIASVGVRLMF